ncbi:MULTISPECIES: heme-copper oxidase subunit III [unclassified Haladaptatus]|uniref:cytochrome c oxidase subunit 3 n=1 Tax=unclassified Haladaptatus TaxID=2622732 RepID=UPI00209BBDCC|nr:MULTISPECIES: heme-copper oxidase subunit III [unclassified Haladaptatus]MCO8244260.1 heme-copper oxidase subunit III [Haladaptatus sp. AB643]MCO8254114.1 heme-copper oxidase subunit III [Haladaptatus sp. AB618]
MTVTDDSTEEHGHHLPAVEDWPKGFGEASWWPIITVLGASGFYVGAALYILGHGGDTMVGPNVGPIVFICAAAVFLSGLYGWVYHAFVKHFWSKESSGSPKLRFGMIMFLCTEIATFGAGFVYYFFIRVGTWPPSIGEVPDVVSSIVFINTILLLASSVTIHWAHIQLRKNNRSGFIAGLATTLVLGVIFLGGQVYEYYDFIIEKGFTFTGGVFNSAFFGLTGLHGLHVTMGAVLLGIVLVRSLYGQYSADRHVSVTTVSMYWHFVDAVWIFLVVVIYFGSQIDF